MIINRFWGVRGCSINDIITHFSKLTVVRISYCMEFVDAKLVEMIYIIHGNKKNIAIHLFLFEMIRQTLLSFAYFFYKTFLHFVETERNQDKTNQIVIDWGVEF